MSGRRKAPPVSEAVFSDELPPPRRAAIQTQDVFFANARRAVSEGNQGRRLKPQASVSFESVGAFLAVLTPKRYELLETVRQHGIFESIEDLARVLHRDRATVSRDIKALGNAGLLRVSEEPFSGHGRRTRIAPLAERLHLQLTL